MNHPFKLYLLCSFFLVFTCLSTAFSESELYKQPRSITKDNIPRYTYKIVNKFPHDARAFTQGLTFSNGFLYEGTGLNGQSSLRKIHLSTGNILLKHRLPFKYFGEGIAVFGDKIVQLTWKSNIAFIYNKNNFQNEDSFTYNREGWGVTFDGEALIMSDGTSYLYFIDTNSFNEIKRLQVKLDNAPVNNINELEYINGKIFANIWMKDYIAVICPGTGTITNIIDLQGLYKEQKNSGEDVLNGIAYDIVNDRLFVTGKLWPFIYEIEIIPQ